MRPIVTHLLCASVLVPILGILVPGCGDAPQDTEAPEPLATHEESERPSLIAAIGSPPPLGSEAAASLRAQLLESLDLEEIDARPAVGDPGLLVEAPPSLPVVDSADLDHYTLRGNLRDQVEHGPGLQTLERLFHREPSLHFEEHGSAILRFATLRPIPGASVYYGTVVPDDALGLARHRARSAELRGGEREGIYEYEIPIHPGKLLGAKYDVRGTRRSGRGVLAWRLEALDVEAGSSRVIDGETAFRCGPCEGGDLEIVPLPSLRLGPFVDQVETDRATVSFETDAATLAYLVYFPEGGGAERAVGERAGTRHEFELHGLRPATRYRYQPVVVDRRGEIHVHRGGTFETAARDLERFEFVALSDSRSGHGAADEEYGGTNARVLRGLLLQAMQGDPRFVVFAGDLIDGYTTSETSYRFELRAWLRAVQPFHAHLPIYEAMGNHEALIQLWQRGWGLAKQDPSAESLFAEMMVNPSFDPERGGPRRREGAPSFDENTYSFDYGNAHFAVVNTNYWYRSHPGNPEHPAGTDGYREGWIADESLAWLDADLAAARARNARHLFVFTHEPGFPNGGHTRDAMYWHGRVPEVLAQRDRYFQVLGRHRVAAVINGDEHNYSRTRVSAALVDGMEGEVVQLISGGAGAPYYAQERGVPWVDAVEAFDTRQHFVRFVIDGAAVRVEAIAITGEVIDSFEL